MRQQAPDSYRALINGAELLQVVRDGRVQLQLAALDLKGREQSRDERLRQRGEIEDGFERGGPRFRLTHRVAQRILEAQAPALRDDVDGRREVARLDSLGEH